MQKSLAAEGGAAIETVFYGHGEKIETGPVTIPATKITAHGYGGAMTYARRYSLAMACGVDADEDDDGNVATNSVGENASPPKTKPNLTGGNRKSYYLKKVATTAIPIIK